MGFWENSVDGVSLAFCFSLNSRWVSERLRIGKWLFWGEKTLVWFLRTSRGWICGVRPAEWGNYVNRQPRIWKGVLWYLSVTGLVWTEGYRCCQGSESGKEGDKQQQTLENSSIVTSQSRTTSKHLIVLCRTQSRQAQIRSLINMLGGTVENILLSYLLPGARNGLPRWLGG